MRCFAFSTKCAHIMHFFEHRRVCMIECFWNSPEWAFWINVCYHKIETFFSYSKYTIDPLVCDMGNLCLKFILIFLPYSKLLYFFRFRMPEGDQVQKMNQKGSIIDTLVALLVRVEKRWIVFLVEKAPLSLPEEAIDFLVSAGKYIAFLLSVLLFIGIFQFNIASLFFLAAFFLARKSIKPLGNQEILGWRMMFYASLLVCVAGFVGGDIVKTLVLWFLGLYILFQIRKEYK